MKLLKCLLSPIGGPSESMENNTKDAIQVIGVKWYEQTRSLECIEQWHDQSETVLWNLEYCEH